MVIDDNTILLSCVHNDRPNVSVSVDLPSRNSGSLMNPLFESVNVLFSYDNSVLNDVICPRLDVDVQYVPQGSSLVPLDSTISAFT